MGNREKLLEGALTCLYEKGYAHTTARDIASTAGVSLAAIGYHFGTTEALLNAALHQAMEQWGEELEAALAGGRDADGHTGSDADAGLAPGDRFVAIWTRVIDSVTANRALWTTQFEVVTELGRQSGPQLRQAEAQEDAQNGLAELFHGINTAEEPELARTVGGFYQALLTGVVVQHLVSPERAMSGRDLAVALREVTARVDLREKV